MKIYNVTTERLIIRCYRLTDAPHFMAAVQNSIKELEPWMSWAKESPTNLDTVVETIRKYRGNFDLDVDNKYVITDKEDNFIGNVGIHSWSGGKTIGKEIGYWIDTRYVGKGYVTEAVTALCKVLFEIEKIDKIIIKCRNENTSSIKIPKKLGFSTVQYKDEARTLFRLRKEEYISTNLPKIQIIALDALDRIIEPSGIKIDPPQFSMKVDKFGIVSVINNEFKEKRKDFITFSRRIFKS